MKTAVPIPMSTIAFALPRRAAARQAGWFGRNVWALSDQVLISGTNFATSVLVARELGPAGFGTFTVVYGALQFANILQSTLVSQPHNVLGATRGGDDYNVYTT